MTHQKTDGNKWDYKFLNSLISYHSERINPIKYQLNLVTLKLCINRDNLGIPKELWYIICEYIEYDILNFKPNTWYRFYCYEEDEFVTVYAKNKPKYCPNDGCPKNGVRLNPYQFMTMQPTEFGVYRKVDNQ